MKRVGVENTLCDAGYHGNLITATSQEGIIFASHGKVAKAKPAFVRIREFLLRAPVSPVWRGVKENQKARHVLVRRGPIDVWS